LKLGGIVTLVAALAACASPQPRYGYSGSQPVYAGNAGSYPAPVYDNTNNGSYSQPQAAASTWGTVTRVDNLGGSKDTGMGALIGAGIGAIAGNQIGRSMNDAKTTGTVAGAIGGGVIGNAVERNQNANNTLLRVYVRLDGGEDRYWDVNASQLHPGIGQRVRVQNDQLYVN